MEATELQWIVTYTIVTSTLLILISFILFWTAYSSYKDWLSKKNMNSNTSRRDRDDEGTWNLIVITCCCLIWMLMLFIGVSDMLKATLIPSTLL